MATAKKGTKTSGKSSAGNRAAGKMKAKGGKPAGPKKRASTTKSAGTKKSTGAKKSAGTGKRTTGGRRELVNTGTDKRYVRRRTDGTFKESDDVGRSLSADRRRKAKTRSKAGQGDRGDR